MSKTKRSYLTDPVEEIVEDTKVSKHSLHNRRPDKLSPDKESRAYYLSHRAFCLMQGMSEKLNIGPAAFLEIFLREKAETMLSKDEIAHLEAIALAMTQRREELIKDLIESQEEPATST